MAFKDYPITILGIALFIVCIFFFTVGTLNEYGISSDQISNSQINFTGIYTSLNNTNNQANAWQQVFTSDNPLLSVAGLVLVSVWGIFKGIWESVKIILELIVFGIAGTLGIPAIVIGTLLTIIVISIIFAGWYLLKSGV